MANLSDPRGADVTRAVDIDSPRSKVWDLLADVGWWLNLGDCPLMPRGDAALDTFEHPDRGRYRIRTKAYQPCTYLSYTCLADNGRPATLVEFFVVGRRRLDAAMKATVVRVVESGFHTLEQQVVSHEEWGVQLSELQTVALRGRLWPWLEENKNATAIRRAQT